MKDETLTNVIEYLSVIQNLENQDVAQWFFRGYGDPSYTLTPSLIRLDITEIFSDWKEV